MHLLTACIFHARILPPIKTKKLRTFCSYPVPADADPVLHTYCKLQYPAYYLKISALLPVFKVTWRCHEPLPCRTPETPLERFITSFQCYGPAPFSTGGNLPAVNLKFPDLHVLSASFNPFIGTVKTIFKTCAGCIPRLSPSP